jgi:hypothetical protein
MWYYMLIYVYLCILTLSKIIQYNFETNYLFLFLKWFFHDALSHFDAKRLGMTIQIRVRVGGQFFTHG